MEISIHRGPRTFGMASTIHRSGVVVFLSLLFLLVVFGIVCLEVIVKQSSTVAVIQAVSATLFDNDLETDDAEDEEEEQQRQQKDHARAVDGRCHSENAGTAMDTNFHGSSTQLITDAGLEMKNIPGIDR